MEKDSGIPILELKSQYQCIKVEINEAIQRVLDRQYFILGEEVQALEEEIALYCGVKYAVGVSSGTDALLLALMAYNIKKGDEVITTPYSFFSTSSCITRLGATPVYVDINDVDFSINANEIEKKINEKTKAILIVQFAGQMCEMDKIAEVAHQYALPLIEDACQSIGATYYDKKAGSIGDIGCFSFYPSKNLGGYGDSGMCITNTYNMAERLRLLRNHGQYPKYHHLEVGGNFRMDDLQAAVLRVKRKYLEDWIGARRKHAEIYNQIFLRDNTPITIPLEYISRRHTYHLYIIRSEKRDWIMHNLRKNNIGCDVYYPLPLHLQPCYKYLGYEVGDMPNSEKAAMENLAIPVYPELTNSQIEFVADIIKQSL